MSEEKQINTGNVAFDQAVDIPRLFTLPMPGEVITSSQTGNTYTIGELIGEGNFGFVFNCTDTWQNELAVKVLKPYSTYEAVREAAINEVIKLAQLRNPYVTYVHDAFEYQDSFYIITEKCAFPLNQILADPAFKDLGHSWVKPIARCLLQAVHFLHINGHAHQDIHPGNVFGAVIKDEFSRPGSNSFQFKLGDLGIAKLLTELSPSNTRANWMLPPEVLDPEQFGPIDHRSDIYHSSLLLLQVAHSQELKFTTEGILSGRPREMALALPAPFNFALEKALRRRVQFRTESAMELWRDLNSPIHDTRNNAFANKAKSDTDLEQLA